MGATRRRSSDHRMIGDDCCRCGRFRRCGAYANFAKKLTNQLRPSSNVSEMMNIQPTAIIAAVAAHAVTRTIRPDEARGLDRVIEPQSSETRRRSRSLSFAALRGGADNNTGSLRRRSSSSPRSPCWSRADVKLLALLWQAPSPYMVGVISPGPQLAREFRGSTFAPAGPLNCASKMASSDAYAGRDRCVFPLDPRKALGSAAAARRKSTARLETKPTRVPKT